MDFGDRWLFLNKRTGSNTRATINFHNTTSASSYCSSEKVLP
jgi:hypothetical protein